MKIVTCILARGGSKGIPNKNIIDVALDDFVRLSKYYLTLDGVKFLTSS